MSSTSILPSDRLRPAQRPAVLVTSGAYNPVHANHLLYLDAARAFLERAPSPDSVRGPPGSATEPPLEIIGAYISALSDRMVGRRRSWAIGRAHRTAMLQLATAESSWVMIVSAKLHGVRLFEAVAKQCAATLGQSVPVIAVCGADGYAASDRFLPSHIPLACVRRTGEDEEWRTLWQQRNSRRRLYLVEDNLQPQARSATQIRAWLEQAEQPEARAQLERHLHPEVLRYLLEHPECHAP